MPRLVSIPRHPDKDVESVLVHLRAGGWRAQVPGGHWARLYCPHGCCQLSVAKSPRSSGNEARRVKRSAAKCPGGWCPSLAWRHGFLQIQCVGSSQQGVRT